MSSDSPPDLLAHLTDDALRLYADAGCGHVVLDADGRIVRINDRLRAWLGDGETPPADRPPFRARIVAADQPRFDAVWAGRTTPCRRRRSSLNCMAQAAVRGWSSSACRRCAMRPARGSAPRRC